MSIKTVCKNACFLFSLQTDGSVQEFRINNLEFRIISSYKEYHVRLISDKKLSPSTPVLLLPSSSFFFLPS
ncbi:MAG: hypothetical protein F6K18_22495 [Okeania sp. SIO2C2]|uniref:hypothetical protein n=1 Tax=Okeania sp. SIO2C2 TaxID=2607787 RepID=UPI0013BDE438|nr:hypothetical protein [Okeania sp. SIO2C2]NEP89379.1 hypothetical protein [Okeania sp. SIO2C2]